MSNVNVDLNMNLDIALAPEIEAFEVKALSEAQKVDAGWWYTLSFNGVEMGDPEGPYPSEEAARIAAHSDFI